MLWESQLLNYCQVYMRKSDWISWMIITGSISLLIGYPFTGYWKDLQRLLPFKALDWPDC